MRKTTEDLEKELEEMISYHEGEIRALRSALEALRGEGQKPNQMTESRANGAEYADLSLSGQIRKLMEEKGGDWTAARLTEALIKKGVQADVRTIGVTLSQDKNKKKPLFKWVDRGVYRLRK